MAGISTGPMAGKTVLVTGGTGGIGKATAAVLHPGVVRTGFAAEYPSPMWKALLPLVRLFLKTPEQGAATSI